METNRIIRLSLSNARLCFAKRGKKERKRKKEREGEKTKKAEREKYKNTENEKTKKKKINFQQNARITTCNIFILFILRIPFCLYIPQIQPRLSVASLDAPAKPFIPFLTRPQPIFLSSSPSPSLFKYSKILFFLCPLPFIPIRVYFVSKNDFTCANSIVAFVPGERAGYFDEREPDFQGKSFQRNWLGEREILKKGGGEGKGEKFDPFDALVKASSLCFRFNSLFHPV